MLMKKKQTCVCGIYNSQTLKILIENNIRRWGFDLRPKSFQFLPTYQLVDLLQQFSYHADCIYLRFSGEKKIVIEKILQDLATAAPSAKEKVILWFSHPEDLDLAQELKWPCLFSFFEGVDYRVLVETDFFKGMIFEGALIEDFFRDDDSKNQLLQFLFELQRTKDTKFILEHQNFAPAFQSELEQLSWAEQILTMDASFELSYRKMNFDHLQNVLVQIKKQGLSHAHFAFQ